jgi:hypothetical protein
VVWSASARVSMWWSERQSQGGSESDVADLRGGTQWLQLRPGASVSSCGGWRPDDLTSMVELNSARSAISTAGDAIERLKSAATFGAEEHHDRAVWRQRRVRERSSQGGKRELCFFDWIAQRISGSVAAQLVRKTVALSKSVCCGGWFG